METAYRQLVLCPTDQDWVPLSHSQLHTILQDFGVVGSRVDTSQQERYLIGNAFLQLFSFMGCAPSIEFAPTSTGAIDWHSFVFVQLSPILEHPRWLVDRSMAKPGCPVCERRMRDWSASYDAVKGTLECVHCQHVDHVCNWRWYDGGGCARQFVSIVNVYPKESLPTDTLLSHLQQETAIPWQYFYLHASLIEK